MESSNEFWEYDIDYCQNPFQLPPCHARQYLTCPHCSFHLCFEHGQQHQAEIQHETSYLHRQARHLEKTINEYEPIQTVTEQVFSSLNEWKLKMYRFIDQYSERVQMHIEQARIRLNDQWNITKEEYLHVLNSFILQPIDQLLKVPNQIHPDEIRLIHTRLTYVQNEITNLFTYRDLLRINCDLCSLAGDINISYGQFPSPKMGSFTSTRSNETIPQLDQINIVGRYDTVLTDTSAVGVFSYGTDNSSQILMTWMEPSTIIIFDTEHQIIKRADVEPPLISINDIVWCDYLHAFFIAGAALHTFDVTNHEIKQIFAPDDPHIWSIATHKTSLLICYVMGESPLIEHRSLPSFRLIQSYTRTQLLPTDSTSTIDIARCIRTNGHHIAMTVRNLTTNEWRVDIFNFHMQRLFKGQIVGQAVQGDSWCCLLTSYRSSWWLVLNNTPEQGTLTLIDRQACVTQQIEHEGYGICALREEERFVIKDRQGLAVFRF